MKPTRQVSQETVSMLQHPQNFDLQFTVKSPFSGISNTRLLLAITVIIKAGLFKRTWSANLKSKYFAQLAVRFYFSLSSNFVQFRRMLQTRQRITNTASEFGNVKVLKKRFNGWLLPLDLIWSSRQHFGKQNSKIIWIS